MSPLPSPSPVITQIEGMIRKGEMQQAIQAGSAALKAVSQPKRNKASSNRVPPRRKIPKGGRKKNPQAPQNQASQPEVRLDKDQRQHVAFLVAVAQANLDGGKKTPKGIEALHELVDIESPYPPAAEALGQYYYKTSDHEKTIRYYEIAISQAKKVTESHFHLASAYFNSGNATEALRWLAPYLEKNPDKIDACILKGQAHNLLGQSAEALAAFENVLKQAPKNQRALYLHALVAQKMDKSELVIQSCRTALALSPGNAQIWMMLGLALHNLNDQKAAYLANNKVRKLTRKENRIVYNQARLNCVRLLNLIGKPKLGLAIFLRQARLEPVTNKSTMDLAYQAYRASSRDIALGSLQEKIDQGSDYPDFFLLLGRLQNQSGDFTDAQKTLEAGLKIHPKHALMRIRLVESFLGRKMNEEAAQILDGFSKDDIAALEPDVRIHYFLRRRTLLSRYPDKKAEAADMLDHALGTDPQAMDAWFGRAFAYDAERRYGASLAVCDENARRFPNQVETYVARGHALSHLNLASVSVRDLDRGLALDPNSVNVHRNMSISKLMLQDYPQGFYEFDWRWKMTNDGNSNAINTRQRLNAPPLTNPEDARGKIVLLYGEQGNGDVIQFLRYVPVLASYGATIWMMVQKVYTGILPLLKNFPGIKVVLKGETPTDDLRYDYHASLMDLPGLFATTLDSIPPPVPFYIDPERKEKWRERLAKLPDLGPDLGPRVGLVCESGKGFLNNMLRSIGFENFRPLFDMPVHYICLQKDIAPEDREWLDKIPNLSIIGPEFENFADTAAVIEELNLVISTCTSTAHLAMTQGVATMTMQPWRGDWRWGLQSQKSLWYESATLVRQHRSRDWSAVLDLLRGKLWRWIDAGCPKTLPDPFAVKSVHIDATLPDNQHA